MNLVFMLEELSMKRFLEGLLPRIVPPEVPVMLIPHEGKSDLEKSLPRKLKAWRVPDTYFVVVRDQDSADCREVKQRLQLICNDCGRSDTLIRIACRELEAWYVADLAAVERAYEVEGLASQQNKKKYRTPDSLGSPSRELKTLVPRFAKVGGARALGPLVALDNERSPSFAAFVSGVRRLVDSAGEMPAD